MGSKDDECYKKESIDFFRSLINFKTNAKKSTRPTNFAVFSLFISINY